MNKQLAILCVDDEPVILESLKEQLKRHLPENYELESAESGEEALEVIAELHQDGLEVALVISDQIMSGLQGDELLIQLHQNYPQMLKIMLTGQADIKSVGNVLNQASLYRYISKPWDETDLILYSRTTTVRTKSKIIRIKYRITTIKYFPRTKSYRTNRRIRTGKTGC